MLLATPADPPPLCRRPGLVHGGACRRHPVAAVPPRRDDSERVGLGRFVAGRQWHAGKRTKATIVEIPGRILESLTKIVTLYTQTSRISCYAPVKNIERHPEMTHVPVGTTEWDRLLSWDETAKEPGGVYDQRTDMRPVCQILNDPRFRFGARKVTAWRMGRTCRRFGPSRRGCALRSVPFNGPRERHGSFVLPLSPHRDSGFSGQESGPVGKGHAPSPDETVTDDFVRVAARSGYQARHQ